MNIEALELVTSKLFMITPLIVTMLVPEVDEMLIISFNKAKSKFDRFKFYISKVSSTPETSINLNAPFKSVKAKFYRSTVIFFTSSN